MSRNLFIKNTFILIISSLIIKVLGLLNRILLTRLLGHEGISLYILSLPTIILFISLCGFSLNTAVSKIVAMNTVSNKYTNKQILFQAFFLGTIASIISIIVLLIIIKPLSNQWLRQPNTFYPILASSLFFPLVAYNNCLRGYFNGIKKVNLTAYASLVEQIVRMIASVVFLYIFIDYGMVFAVTMTIIAMTVGELGSFVFACISYFKIKRPKFKPLISQNPQNEILKIALPQTASKLVGNLSYFFEPILYTSALTLIGFSAGQIRLLYSEYSAYAEGLLTMLSFVSASIAISIIPHISESLALQNYTKIRFYIKKTLLASILPGIIFTVLLLFYAKEYMYLVYKTDLGVQYVKQFAILFLASYVISPLVSIMNTLGYSKETFIWSTCFNILKLILIFSLVFIPQINYYSLIIATSITLILYTLVIYFRIKNIVYFKFTFSEKVNVLLLAVLSFFIVLFLRNVVKLHYLLVSIIALLIFVGSFILLKIFHLDHK